MTWDQIDFEAESAWLGNITNRQVAVFAIDYLRSQSLQISPGQGRDGRPPVHVIVDHAEGKLAIQNLIDRANTGHFCDRHVILGMSNDGPHSVLSFCTAAFVNGAASITIPSTRVVIPIVILTAEHLRLDSNTPEQSPNDAWKKAEADVLEKLSEVVTESKGDDVEAIRLIDKAFPVQPGARKMSEMFLGERGATNDTIHRIKQFIKDAELNFWNQLI